MLSTFSIVACDLTAGQWGVAVQSKFLAAGAVIHAVGTRTWHDPKRGESSRRTPQAFTKGQPPLSNGRQASSALIVETTLK